MNIKTLAFAIFVLAGTAGCSGTYHAYYDTLKIAFSAPQDANMTQEEVSASKTDVMSVKRGERPIAIMALAYLENGQHKWVSGDNAIMIMEKGRVVRTVGLDKNLLYLSNTESDPLKTITNTSAVSSWLRSADWSGDEYGYPIHSSFSQPTSQTLRILNKDIETTLYAESLVYDAPSDYIRLNREWQNLYWFDKQTGTLVKSIQTLSPISEPIEFIYLSRIARLN
ncbi:YjbF family lipoprotein [Paraglaciecola sp. 20A4]|uniref:YjbF family lipoprotein n=1 Tax=Paraglaciecola sp. 20A4 TaxID=2687288 RepID=UPI00140803AB|nr:YjbF family lipoprotein [Paraglaciecola sp. 20A4]